MIARLWSLLLLLSLLLAPASAWAGPVSWQEVPPTAEGRQWWDQGSLRFNRAGNLTVLSRFEAAGDPQGNPPLEAAAKDNGPGDAGTLASPPRPPGALPTSASPERTAAGRPAAPLSRLYVMELDCDQSLYRDISINGLPQFRATWQPTGSDDLTAEVLRQACAAGAA